jgi:patatin-like phospholipase/acyl hydrolase
MANLPLRLAERKQSDVSARESASTYHLLSLSGGGVRGIFQARFLQRLEEALNTPLRNHFSGVAATSTGAIVGLSIAAGIPAKNVFDLYQDNAPKIFRKKALSPLRSGGRYSTKLLEELLKKQFGDRRVGDLPIDIFIAASTADTYQGQIFTKADISLRLVDVALASAAAPTFFPARQVGDDQRAYLDGGLWANNPSLAAIRTVIDTGTSSQDIALLSIGCGRTPKGSTYTELVHLKTLSLDTPRLLLDSVSGLQEWFVHRSLKQILSPTQVVEINPVLRDWIALDDWKEALSVLPALADSEYAHGSEYVRSILNYKWNAPELDQMRAQLEPSLVKGASVAKLNTFVPARKYYKDLRNGRDSITSYIATAQHTLRIVGVNLMTGNTLESILDTFRTLICRPGMPVTVILSLLDPEQDHLMKTMGPNLNMESAELADQIVKLISRTKTFYNSLDPALRSSFELHLHGALPSASAIMIDIERQTGVIQLETKAYSRPAIEAFGFEVGYGSELYSSLRDGYLKLIADGRRLL